ncbi:hypothetical protein [Mucilaginibacter gynuensis]
MKNSLLLLMLLSLVCCKQQVRKHLKPLNKYRVEIYKKVLTSKSTDYTFDVRTSVIVAASDTQAYKMGLKMYKSECIGDQLKETEGMKLKSLTHSFIVKKFIKGYAPTSGVDIADSLPQNVTDSLRRLIFKRPANKNTDKLI